MDLFQSILANIKKKLDSETVQTETIARIASEVLGMTVTVSMIHMKGKQLVLKVPPTARMRLLVKRPQLLSALQKESIAIVSIN